MEYGVEIMTDTRNAPHFHGTTAGTILCFPNRNLVDHVKNPGNFEKLCYALRRVKQEKKETNERRK
jgi:hypothetical protein